MKKLLAAGAAAAVAASTLLLAPTSATAAPAPVPCAEMGRNVNILNTSTPTCIRLFTSGASSVKLPSDAPRIVYGVVNMVSPGVAPKSFTSQNGVTYPLNPTEGKRWLSVGPAKASQTIVAAEIVNKKIGKTFPYLFITDDAITDRFAGKTFIGRTANDKSSKNKISIWTRIDWAGGLSQNGGLHGQIMNYKKNVVEKGTCKPAMVKQHIDMVKQRFGQKGKVELSWNPGIYQGQNSLLVLNTEKTSFSHPAPTALTLANKVWKPGKINFTLRSSNTGLSKIYIDDIRGTSAVKYCSLK